MPAEERPVGAHGRWLDYAAVAVAVAILAAWLHHAADRPLTWDEVDYVVAARAGTWANLTDRGALGPVAFARFALAKAGWGDAEEVARTAGYVEEESLLHLRHWHPPAGLLLLPPAISAAGPERGARLMQLALATLLALLMVPLLRHLAPERGLLRAGAVLVVLLDPLTRHALLEAHVHVAVAVAFLLPVWAWLRATRVPLDARRLGELQEAGAGRPTAPMGGRAGALVMGIALGVLWSAAVVGPLWTVLWIGCIWLHRDVRDWLVRGGGAPWVAAGALVALVVSWPGAFVKVSLLQTYALRVYALLFQDGREWGGATAALVTFVRQEPNLMLYALLGVTAFGVGLVRGRRDALGTGAATVAFLIVIVPFAIIDRYLLPLVPLAVLSGVALVGSGDPEWPTASRAPVRWGVAVVTGLLIMGWALGSGRAYPDARWTRSLREEYVRVSRLASGGDEVLAEGGHIFRFYAEQEADAMRSVLVDYDGRRLLLRDGVRYDTVSVDRRAWIVLQRRSTDEPEVFDQLSASCGREEFPTHVHFACGGVSEGR